LTIRYLHCLLISLGWYLCYWTIRYLRFLLLSLDWYLCW